MSVDLNVAQARLAQRKAELEQLSDLSKADRATVELDQSAVGRVSRMDAMQQQAMGQARERRRQDDLIRIELAERRIADGDYGYCEDCGENIPDKRLEIDPMANLCVGCMAR